MVGKNDKQLAVGESFRTSLPNPMMTGAPRGRCPNNDLWSKGRTTTVDKDDDDDDPSCKNVNRDDWSLQPSWPTQSIYKRGRMEKCLRKASQTADDSIGALEIDFVLEATNVRKEWNDEIIRHCSQWSFISTENRTSKSTSEGPCEARRRSAPCGVRDNVSLIPSQDKRDKCANWQWLDIWYKLSVVKWFNFMSCNESNWPPIAFNICPIALSVT